MGGGKIADSRRGAGSLIEMRRALGCVLILMALAASPGWAADLNAEQVRAILAAVAPGKLADLSGKALESLDLSNLDVKRANLSGANLLGAKLEGADLSGAKLDLAWLVRANLTNADLSKATLLGLVVSSGLEISLAEAPVFRGANFSGARIIARLSQFDLSGANFA